MGVNYGMKWPLVFLALLAGCGGGGGETPSSTAKQAFLTPLPDDGSRSGVELKTASDWRVIRQWPDGAVVVFRKEQRQSFPAGLTALAQSVIASGDRLYILTYNTAGPVGGGLDVWRFGENVTLMGHLVFGDVVNNAIYARELNGDIDACSINKCLRLKADGVSAWNADLTGKEIVDLHFVGDEAHAVVRPVNGVAGNPSLSGYSVVRMNVSGSTAQELPAECVPFNLRVESGVPAWSCAKTNAELAQILKDDLARRGIGEIGLPNTDGRIAWGLVYVLNAMIHLDSLPKLSAAMDWGQERALYREALSLVARQGLENPLGYASRRYSIDRSPLLFALHLGRIKHLLDTATKAGLGSPEITSSLAGIKVKLDELRDTAEVPSVESGYETLAFKKGTAFKEDGVNVPFNFLSAYVLGVLSGDGDKNVSKAAALMRPLQDLEPIGSSDMWRYWWGHGRTGWQESDGISVNTPSYSGHDGLADITYRSMDAMALVRLASVDSKYVPNSTVENIRALVSSGKLLPFVNQELARIGKTASLEPAVARRYARSSAPWEIQSQVWALESLMVH